MPGQTLPVNRRLFEDLTDITAPPNIARKKKEKKALVSVYHRRGREP